MKSVIEVRDLVKHYGPTVAIDGLSLTVEEGEIFGMVGPNGAGKTTTIECIEGLRRGDSGEVLVLGCVPGNGSDEISQRIGVQLQESSLPPRMKVGEALGLFSSFYRRSVDPDELIGQLGLEEKRDAFFDHLSGGQKQRLFIALALVNDPDVVFLDELTTGLDPHARHAMWDLVRAIRERGKTVFLTTHFMEEAEKLCDRVAIIDRGRIVALDTPRKLVAGLDGGTRIVLTAPDLSDAQEIRALDGVESVERVGEQLTIRGRGAGLAGRVLQRLTAAGVEIRDVRTESPSLEDVFLALTGHSPDGGES